MFNISSRNTSYMGSKLFWIHESSLDSFHIFTTDGKGSLDYTEDAHD